MRLLAGDENAGAGARASALEDSVSFRRGCCCLEQASQRGGYGTGLTAFHVMTSSNEYDSVSSVAGKGDIQHCVYTVGGQS